MRSHDNRKMGSIMKMKKVELAAAVGAGYLLGRTRQLKTAVKIARVGGPQDLLTAGSTFLASSPETAQLGDSARDRLLDTTAAASEQAESFGSRLRSRGANVRAGTAHLATEVRNKARRHPHPTQDTAADTGPDTAADNT